MSVSAAQLHDLMELGLEGDKLRQVIEIFVPGYFRQTSEWRRIRVEVLVRDLAICAYCLDPADQVDHILPLCQGGTNDPANLTAACRTCNASKGGLTPEQWAARDGFRLPPWFLGRVAG